MTALSEYAEKNRILKRIGELEKALKLALDDSGYYREQLQLARADLITIYNIIGAKTEVPDSETQDQAWRRLSKSIIEKLKNA